MNKQKREFIRCAHLSEGRNSTHLINLGDHRFVMLCRLCHEALVWRVIRSVMKLELRDAHVKDTITLDDILRD